MRISGRNKLNVSGKNGHSPKEFGQKEEDILLKNFNAQWHYYKRLVQDTPSGLNQMDKKAYKYMNKSMYLDNMDS
jgi:hypothetical protein